MPEDNENNLNGQEDAGKQKKTVRSKKPASTKKAAAPKTKASSTSKAALKKITTTSEKKSPSSAKAAKPAAKKSSPAKPRAAAAKSRSTAAKSATAKPTKPPSKPAAKKEELKTAPEEKSTAKTILFTGGTGFIGSSILRALIKENPDTNFINLITLSDTDKADTFKKDILSDPKLKSVNLENIQADITADNFGLDNKKYDAITNNITEVWHLAALYSLSADYYQSYDINFIGTKNVISLCKSAPHFEKLIYFSSVVVSGDRQGIVYENELEMGQKHRNNYEITKFLTEIELQKEIAEGLKAIIIRPPITVGDSNTGAASKFDGIYYLFKIIDALKWFPLSLPRIGAGENTLNIIPIDYLTKASLEIATHKDAIGKTFHVVDPSPMTAKEIYDHTCHLITGKPSGFFIAKSFIDLILSYLPNNFISSIPKEIAAYLDNTPEYDHTNTDEILKGKNINCPDIRDYFPTLYEYWKEHN